MSYRKNEYRDLNRWRKTKAKGKSRYYRKTQNAKNGHKLWDRKDEKLVLEHRMTDTELAEAIGRSVAAIQIRRARLRADAQKLVKE